MNTRKAGARLMKVIRREHRALAAERSYCAWLRRYCGNLKGLPAHFSGEQKLERFLSAPAPKHVTCSTQNQALRLPSHTIRRISIFEHPAGGNLGSVSLTPRFNEGFARQTVVWNRFNGFHSHRPVEVSKTVETVQAAGEPWCPSLKRGVNEINPALLKK